MPKDNWTESYRREQGKPPGGLEKETPLAPEISPGVMARGPVADEVNPELGAAPEEGTAEEDRAIAKDELPPT